MDDPRLYQRIYAEMSARIDSGSWPSGTRINIGALADEFAAGRDSVKHALALLGAEGRVQRWPGLGWFVA